MGSEGEVSGHSSGAHRFSISAYLSCPCAIDIENRRLRARKFELLFFSVVYTDAAVKALFAGILLI